MLLTLDKLYSCVSRASLRRIFLICTAAALATVSSACDAGVEAKHTRTASKQGAAHFGPAAFCSVDDEEVEQFDATEVTFKTPPNHVRDLWSDTWWNDNFWVVFRAMTGVTGRPITSVQAAWWEGETWYPGVRSLGGPAIATSSGTEFLAATGLRYQSWLWCVINRLSEKLNLLPNRSGPKQKELAPVRGYFLLTGISPRLRSHTDHEGKDPDQVIGAVRRAYGNPPTWFADPNGFFSGRYKYEALEPVPLTSTGPGGQQTANPPNWRQAPPDKVMIFRGAKIPHSTAVSSLPRAAAVVIFAPKNRCAQSGSPS